MSLAQDRERFAGGLAQQLVRALDGPPGRSGLPERVSQHFAYAADDERLFVLAGPQELTHPPVLDLALAYGLSYVGNRDLSVVLPRDGPGVTARCYRHRYMRIVRQEWMSPFGSTRCAPVPPSLSPGAPWLVSVWDRPRLALDGRWLGTCELRPGVGRATRRRSRGATKMVAAGVGPRPSLPGARYTPGHGRHSLPNERCRFLPFCRQIEVPVTGKGQGGRQGGHSGLHGQAERDRSPGPVLSARLQPRVRLEPEDPAAHQWQGEQHQVSGQAAAVHQHQEQEAEPPPRQQGQRPLRPRVRWQAASVGS